MGTCVTWLALIGSGSANSDTKGRLIEHRGVNLGTVVTINDSARKTVDPNAGLGW